MYADAPDLGRCGLRASRGAPNQPLNHSPRSFQSLETSLYLVLSSTLPAALCRGSEKLQEEMGVLPVRACNRSEPSPMGLFRSAGRREKQAFNAHPNFSPPQGARPWGRREKMGYAPSHTLVPADERHSGNDALNETGAPMYNMLAYNILR